MAIEEAVSVEALVSRDDYQAARPRIFPSAGALDWFIRENRSELIKAEAISLIRQRWLINPSVFDAFVLRLGAAAAAKKIAG